MVVAIKVNNNGNNKESEETYVYLATWTDEQV